MTLSDTLENVILSNYGCTTEIQFQLKEIFKKKKHSFLK